MSFFGGAKGSVSLKDMPESDRVRFFIEDILAPIVSADGIDDVESKALNSAWFLYGMDGSYRKDKFRRLIDSALETRTNAACAKTVDGIREAFRRVSTMVDDTTYNEFLALVGWFSDLAKRSGGALFSPRPDPRWAEQHFRAKVDEIRKCKDKSDGVASRLPNTKDAVETPTDVPGVLPSPDTQNGNATSASGAASGPKPEFRSEDERRPADQTSDGPSGDALAATAELGRAGIVSKPGVTPYPAPKPKEDPGVDPPKQIAAGESQTFWDEVANRVDSLLQNLPQEANQILAEFGPVERSYESMLFRESRGDPLWKALSVMNQEASSGGAIWILGDLHGDLLGLESAIHYIERQDNDFRLVLLGDLFDRGRDSYPVVLRILRLVSQRRKHICLLAGNHDIAMSAGEGSRSAVFRSDVDPSDFTEWLNSKGTADPVAREVGRVVVRMCQAAPRALFFEDGVLLAHGGIPHSDLWGSIRCLADLNSEQCLEDFVWTRAAENAPRKRPNRMSRGCQFGFSDFFDFCRKAEDILGHPVNRMIRAHDHVDDQKRVAVYGKWGNRVVTINNMCSRLPGEEAGLAVGYVRMPALVKFEPGKKDLEIHALNIPRSLVERVYPEPKRV